MGLRSLRGRAMAQGSGDYRDGDDEDRDSRRPGNALYHPAPDHPAADRLHIHPVRRIADRSLQEITQRLVHPAH